MEWASLVEALRGPIDALARDLTHSAALRPCCPPPAPPPAWGPASATGQRLYTPGLVRFFATKGAENKIFRAKAIIPPGALSGPVGEGGEWGGPVVGVNLSPEVGLEKWGKGGGHTALPELLVAAVTAAQAHAQAKVTGFSVVTALGADGARVIKAPQQVSEGLAPRIPTSLTQSRHCPSRPME